LTELRKLILGLTPEFTNNTSWRFFDAAHKFVDPFDPWRGALSETYAIENLSRSMDLSFIGVKVGDVNGNAKGVNANQANTESRSTLRLSVDDRKVFKGEIIEVPVMVANTSDFYGMQAQFKANGLIIREMKDGVVKVNPSDFKSTTDQISIALANGAGQRIPAGKTVFILEVEVLRNGNLSEMLTIGTDLNPEAYTESMDVKSLSLNWRSDDTGFNLTSVSPNPWNAQTEIQFELPEDGMVTFKVRDYTGKKVISTVDQYTTGHNSIRIQRSDLGVAGVYVYEVRYGEKVLTGKMIVID
jgi:Secretion system C-terminal sorting domain